MSISFKKYHLDHHRYQGNERKDVDIPCFLETQLFTRTLPKLLWTSAQGLFYCVRPLFINPKPMEALEALNIALQLAFNFTVWHFLGSKSILYLGLGALLGTGLHPL